jgi:hypothetical protein
MVVVNFHLDVDTLEKVEIMAQVRRVSRAQVLRELISLAMIAKQGGG